MLACASRFPSSKSTWNAGNAGIDDDHQQQQVASGALLGLAGVLRHENRNQNSATMKPGGS
jgi:hypothetical protein